MLIRHADEKDLQHLNDINNYYILNTNASFDVQPQTLEQRAVWFHKYKTSGPYQILVAEEGGKVIGCAYSSRYREHFSFDQTIETSIYVDHEVRTKGVGTKLYQSLFEALKPEPVHLAVVGIALPNEGSIALHKKFGFEVVGTFKEYALKKGQYVSSIWMQKII